MANGKTYLGCVGKIQKKVKEREREKQLGKWQEADGEEDDLRSVNGKKGTLVPRREKQRDLE